jgi:hypothetical protein
MFVDEVIGYFVTLQNPDLIDGWVIRKLSTTFQADCIYDKVPLNN